MSSFEKKMGEMVMKNLAQSMLNDLVSPKSGGSVSQQAMPSINKAINAGMSKSFGESWDVLPVTGPRMMALVFILNTVLGSQGITPKKIAEVATTKAKDLQLDDKVTKFLETIKTKNKFSADDIKSFANSLGDQAKGQVKEMLDVVHNVNVWGTLGSVGNAVSDIGEKGLEGAKSIGKSVGGLFKRKKNTDEDE